jgi:hypothetical protein
LTDTAPGHGAMGDVSRDSFPKTTRWRAFSTTKAPRGTSHGTCARARLSRQNMLGFWILFRRGDGVGGKRTGALQPMLQRRQQHHPRDFGGYVDRAAKAGLTPRARRLKARGALTTMRCRLCRSRKPGARPQTLLVTLLPTTDVASVRGSPSDGRLGRVGYEIQIHEQLFHCGVFVQMAM